MVSMRAVGAAAAVAALVGCGSGVRQGSPPSSSGPVFSSGPPSSSVPPFSGGPPPPTASKSLAVPVSSWPNPAASNLSVPPAVSVPSVTLVDVEHGVALAGSARIGSGSQDGGPSTLWLSTDLNHWRDVTPPAARQQLEGGLYAMFDQASFLNPTTGWVSTWNLGNLAVTIYATADGGQQLDRRSNGRAWRPRRRRRMDPTRHAERGVRRKHRSYRATHVALGHDGCGGFVAPAVLGSATGRTDRRRTDSAPEPVRVADGLHLPAARVRCQRYSTRGRPGRRRVLRDASMAAFPGPLPHRRARGRRRVPRATVTRPTVRRSSACSLYRHSATRPTLCSRPRSSTERRQRLDLTSPQTAGRAGG